MFDFDNQVVVIAGAVGNLGSAVARCFLPSKAKMVLIDHSEDHLKQVFPDLVDSPDYLLANCSDLTDPESVKRAIMQAKERFGRIDVLVNAVGSYRAGTPLHETPIGTWELMLNLNARTVFISSQCAIPLMLDQDRGKIISIAARPGLKGKANMAAYSAAKSAVIRMTESMAAELRQKNINVNCILPGTIDTPQNRAAMPEADYSRWVKPESLGDVILFLASDLARDVHGAAIPVYGKS